MKKKTKREIISLISAWLLLVIAVTLSIIIVIYISRHSENVEILIKNLGIIGPITSIALYAVLGASPIPSDPLTLINGAVFGPILGTLISWVGNMVAAWMEYFIGAKISQVTEFEQKRQHLPWGLSKFPADSPWFLFAGRFIPEYGGKIVSVIGGLYRVPLWRYTWTAAISTLLGSALFALGGYGLVKLL